MQACFSVPETHPIFLFSHFENAVSVLAAWTVTKQLKSAQKPPGIDTTEGSGGEGVEQMPKGKAVLCRAATSAALVWIWGFS